MCLHSVGICCSCEESRGGDIDVAVFHCYERNNNHQNIFHLKLFLQLPENSCVVMKFGKEYKSGISKSVSVDLAGSFGQAVKAYSLDSVAQSMYVYSFACTLVKRNNS